MRLHQREDDRGEIVGSFATFAAAEQWVNARTQFAVRSTNASDIA